MRPSAITATSSAKARASSGSWVTTIVVILVALAFLAWAARGADFSLSGMLQTTLQRATPLALGAMAETAGKPAALALYCTAPEAAPAVDAWQRELGVPVHIAGPWNWQTAHAEADVSLFSDHQGWQLPAALQRTTPDQARKFSKSGSAARNASLSRCRVA